MKRIIFCFDGTTNELGAVHPTNVVLVAEGIAPTDHLGITQIIHYDEGVGTNQSFKLRGTIFGAGLLDNIAEAYRFLIFNYERGDEIYVFGFSRGAFTARSFVGLMREVGVVNRADAGQIDAAVALYQAGNGRRASATEAASRFRAQFSSAVCVDQDDDRWRCDNHPGYTSGQSPLLKVAYVGVWDTVAAMGIPEAIPGSNYVNRSHRFHDHRLCEIVENARHAVAIDEKRRTFPPSLWDNLAELNGGKGFEADAADAPYQQQWFPGTHGSVGGGWPIRALSDGALDWVSDGATQLGWVLDVSQSSRIYSIQPDHRGPLTSSEDRPSVMGWAKRLVSHHRQGPVSLHEVSLSARKRWAEIPARLPEKQAYRPPTLAKVSEQLDAAPKPLMSEAEVLCPDRLTDLGVSASEIRMHVIGQGDSLTKIAVQYFGSNDKAHLIFQLNRDSMDDPDKLIVGSRLRIPSVRKESENISV